MSQHRQNYAPDHKMTTRYSALDYLTVGVVALLIVYLLLSAFDLVCQ